MTVSYEKIDALCKAKMTNVTEICKITGVPRSALSDYKAGRKKTVSADYLEKIANALEVDVNSFYTENQYYCLLCGSDTFDLDGNGATNHRIRHAKWEKAVEKFGFCWPVRVRESIKAEARHKIDFEDLDCDSYVFEQLRVFKSLFSRSLEASDYSLDHVDFGTYVAMLLNQEQWKGKIQPFVYKSLVNSYGSLPGIESGSYYSVDEQKEKAPTHGGEREIGFDDFTYAMQNETKELTEEDKAILLSMARQLKIARDKRNGGTD